MRNDLHVILDTLDIVKDIFTDLMRHCALREELIAHFSAADEIE